MTGEENSPIPQQPESKPFRQPFSSRRNRRAALKTAGLLLSVLSVAACGGAEASGIAPTPIPYTPTATATTIETATPIPIMTATATEAAAVSTAAPAMTDVELKPGQCINAPAFSVVQGDVQVNGQPIYDNRADTGLIVEMNQEGQVCAPFGADVSFVGQANMAAVIGQDTELMKEHGCGSSTGCASVTVVKFGN